MKLPWHRDIVTHRVNPHKHHRPVRDEKGYIFFLCCKKVAIERYLTILMEGEEENETQS